MIEPKNCFDNRGVLPGLVRKTDASGWSNGWSMSGFLKWATTPTAQQLEQRVEQNAHSAWAGGHGTLARGVGNFPNLFRFARDAIVGQLEGAGAACRGARG
jgi:hypothetical protein